MGDGGERSFLASVVEQTDTGVLVEPLESEAERKSADRISFRTENLDPLDLQVGDVVNICYTGQIQEPTRHHSCCQLEPDPAGRIKRSMQEPASSFLDLLNRARQHQRPKPW